jgi:hypothetical protein
MESVDASYPWPGHCVFDLSDGHLVMTGDLYGQVDAEARLRGGADAGAGIRCWC